MSKGDFRQAVMDMASALKDVMKNYSFPARRKAWKILSGPKGEKEMAEMISQPNRPLTRFRKISFAEWIENKEKD